MRLGSIALGVAIALAISTAAHAQGRGNGNGNGNAGGNGNGNSNRPTPPAQSALPSSNSSAPAATAAVPFAWIDDASMLSPGAVAISISAFRWQGTDISEVDLPVVSASVGAAKRLQFGVSLPHVVGDSSSGVVGGLGTTYINGKIGIISGDRVKLAVAPTLEILGDGALQSLSPGERRTQFGVPVSVEGDSGVVRVFASAGGFTPGIWFAGGGVGVQATQQISVSGALSGAWSNAPSATTVTRRRNEASGSVAYSPTAKVSLYGSFGHTFATTDENGAGATVSGGVVFVIVPNRASP
jgi:hypothetical protein